MQHSWNRRLDVEHTHLPAWLVRHYGALIKFGEQARRDTKRAGLAGLESCKVSALRHYPSLLY